MAHLKWIGSFIASVLLIVVIATTSTQAPGILFSQGGSSGQADDLSQAHRISNPAAVYCTDLGYAYQVVGDGAGGQTDTCTLPDGQVCSAWDFLEGKCGQTYSYCAKQGLGERVASDGKNPFSFDYAVCVDAQGKDVGQATVLSNLAPKLIHCAGAISPGNTAGGGTGSTRPAASKSRPFQAKPGSLPAAYDWRNAMYNGVTGNWTSPVKNQGSCGSCWAFAAVGQVEAALNLYAGNPALDENLAEEYLVSDCTTAGTCCGGWHDLALDYIAYYGIPDEACLPYVSGSCGCSSSGVCSCAYKSSGKCANATCSQRCSDYASRLNFIDDYGYVSPDQASIKQALITYGPLSVAMDIGDAHWNSNGVLYCQYDQNLDHSVVIVGYNDAGGYWIVKNSWGSTWNGDGFFKVGYGQCQIEDYVYYVQPDSNLRTISGSVQTGAGAGISGVVMNGLPGNPTTDAEGNYTVEVANGWSGTVSPGKAGYTFYPPSRSYSTLTRDQSGQIYATHTVLLVDDDDNAPDVRPAYTAALDALGRSYDIWDTSIKSDPDAATLASYDYVIWFTGAREGGNAGPDGAGELALTSYLGGGGRLMISSQDYYKDRGLTGFMEKYLGVVRVTSDVGQTSVAGSGSPFAGLGPYTLNYSFANSSDALVPAGGAGIAFSGDHGSAGVEESGEGYYSVYLGFPFEALPSATAGQQVMKAFLEWGFTDTYIPLVIRK